MRGIRVAILAAAMAAPPVAGIGWAVGVAQAQVVLSQTLDYDGQWAIDYPAGWVVHQSGFPVLASTASAVGTLVLNDPLPAGSMVFGIIPPEASAMLGVTPGMTLEDAARRVASFYSVPDVAPMPFETTAGPAVSASLGATPRLPHGSTLVIVDHAGGIFVLLVVVADFGGATPLLQQMLATLR